MVNAWIMRPLPMTLSEGSLMIGGQPISNATNDYLGVVAGYQNLAGQYLLTADFGSAAEYDQIMMFGTSGMGTSRYFNSVRGADDAGFTTNVVAFPDFADMRAGANAPTHGRDVGYMDLGTTVSRRFVRGFHTTSPGWSIGRLAIGKKITLARNFSFGAGFGLRDLGSTEFGDRAQLLRRRGSKLRTVGISFSSAYKDEVIAAIRPIIELCGAQEPIVLCTDPTADSDRQNRCYFGPMTGDLGVVQRNAVGWEWKVNLTDLVPIPKTYP